MGFEGCSKFPRSPPVRADHCREEQSPCNSTRSAEILVMATAVHLRTKPSSVHEELSFLTAMPETSKLSAQLPLEQDKPAGRTGHAAGYSHTGCQRGSGEQHRCVHAHLGLQTLFVCSGGSRATTQHPGAESLPHAPPTQHGYDPAPTPMENISLVPSDPPRAGAQTPPVRAAAPAPLPGPGCGGTDTQREQHCKAGAGLGAALASYKYPGAEVTTKATAELCTTYHGNTAQPPNLTALYFPAHLSETWEKTLSDVPSVGRIRWHACVCPSGAAGSLATRAAGLAGDPAGEAVGEPWPRAPGHKPPGGGSSFPGSTRLRPPGSRSSKHRHYREPPADLGHR